MVFYKKYYIIHYVNAMMTLYPPQAECYVEGLTKHYIVYFLFIF